MLFVLFVFPVYWMVNTSFQPNNEIRGSEIHFWPDNFTLRNYETVLFDPGRTPFLPRRRQLAHRHDHSRSWSRSSSRSSRRSR